MNIFGSFDDTAGGASRTQMVLGLTYPYDSHEDLTRRLAVPEAREWGQGAAIRKFPYTLGTLLFFTMSWHI